MSARGRHSLDEQAAAAAVASLKGFLKRTQAESSGSDDFSSRVVSSDSGPLKKRQRAGSITDPNSGGSGDGGSPASAAACASRGSSAKKGKSGSSGPPRELRPYPFFYYRDHSTAEDDDPLAPLTPPGRVPNFPAKMHAILSRPELFDVIAWAPHGRAFRVLRPRQFEVRVIPTFFDHSKFSSFVRQANGWGFRRITQGPDRNCYYHEMFLRGMPHLCKKMTRPGASGKPSADPDHEPDLYRISETLPVAAADSSKGGINHAVSLPWTVEDGPKARMPVHMGLLSPRSIDAASMKTDSPQVDDKKVRATMSADAPLHPAPENLHPYLQGLPPLAPKPSDLPTHGAMTKTAQLNNRQDSKMPAAAVLAPKPPAAWHKAASVAPLSHMVIAPASQAVQALPQQHHAAYLQPAVAAMAPSHVSPQQLPQLAPCPAPFARMALVQAPPSQQQQQQAPYPPAPTAMAPGYVPQPYQPQVPHPPAMATALAQAPPPLPIQPQPVAAPPTSMHQQQPPGTVPHNPAATSQFAAGFAAATALTQSAIQAMVHQAVLAATVPQPHLQPSVPHPHMVMPPSAAMAAVVQPHSAAANTSVGWPVPILPKDPP
mmetsp:Transcript_57269/g.170774  ORF Transcript_57269/g.170774 Transcript_57269/m.170774 type:complete len:601 (-) Transcript_57269:235-2037(-)